MEYSYTSARGVATLMGEPTHLLYIGRSRVTPCEHGLLWSPIYSPNLAFSERSVSPM